MWCYGQGKFRVRVRIRVWVRVVNMFGVMVMVRVNTTQNLNNAAAEAQKGLYLRSYPYRRYNKLILVSF